VTSSKSFIVVEKLKNIFDSGCVKGKISTEPPVNKFHGRRGLVLKRENLHECLVIDY